MARTRSKSSVKPVGAVQAAIEILRYLANSTTPLGVNRISEGVERYPSTCYSILKTLEVEGLVTFDREAKVYGLGVPSLLELLHKTRKDDRHFQLARPTLLDIAARFNTTIMLSERVRRDMMIVIDYVVPDRAFHINVTIGQRVPIIRGSMGRVVLSHENLSRGELEELFNQFNPKAKKSDLEAWIRAVANAKTQGYVVEPNSITEGLTALSVPILNNSGQSHRVMTAIGLSQQLTNVKQKELGAELINLLKTTKASS
jgi:DNA-binding IclR family transcriptional regulator